MGWVKTFALLSILAVAGCGFPKTRYEVKIVTEKGEPISNAHIDYSWSEGGDPWTGKGVRHLSGITFSAQNGLAKFTGSSRVTFLSVKKAGFYPSGVALNPESMKQKPFEIVLRAVLNPVALHGKQANVELEGERGEVGYDLLKGDLMAPHGKGEIEDFKIRWTRPERNHAQDRSAAFDFIAPGEGDGFTALHLPYEDGRVAKSDFHTLYQAPESEYVSGLHESALKSGEGSRNTFVYYFRIRSKSPTGPIYGKIVSGPQYIFNGEGNCFKFVYMLNTTGSRNLEPDIKLSTKPRLGRLEYSLQSSSGLENR